MKDLEKQIEDVKQKISDYVRIAERFKFPKKEQETQINMMLEDLHRLMKQKEK